MLENNANNKRIAKNTLILYLRMLFTLVLQLYTSRLILQALGVEDYGIYNVVGGIVTMLNFINMSLANANSRFIAVELESGNKNSIKKLFSCIISIHYLFALIIFIIAETVGLWFILNKLVIPEGRMTAALWVYQGAVLTSLITVISSPFNGLIIAHEKMSAFALISIFDAVAKLLIALYLFITPADRLIVYAVLLVLVQFVDRLIYTIYCKMKFQESKYKFLWDKNVSYNVLSFAGWTITGNIAVMGYTQGLNILLNLFFGTAVNAARGISVQVQGASRMFTAGFQTAINPQIIKSYAQQELVRMHKLIISSSRFSFYMMLMVTIPVCLHTQYIMRLWLGSVPKYTSEFVLMMMAVGLIQTLQNPIMTALHATGKIKSVQIVESTLLLSVVPIAYLCLKYFRISPMMVFGVYFIIEFITQFVRVFMIYPKIKMDVVDYFSKVLLPIGLVMVMSVGVSTILKKYIIVDNFFSLVLASSAYVLITALSVFCFGITKEERLLILRRLFNKVNNFTHR